MNAFESFIKLIAEWHMQRPKAYGLFHMLWISATIIACVLIFIFRNRINKKAINITLIVWGSVLIVLEVIKQLMCSFRVVDGAAVWDYAWYAFPFQFCSSPLIVALPAGIIKKEKIKDALLCFIALYCFFGGLITVMVPNDVFVEQAFLDWHTMLWHNSMIVIGFLLLATKQIKLNFNSMLKAFIVFGCFVSVALIVDLCVGSEFTNAHNFNLYYISPYKNTHLPVYSIIQENTPYVIFLFTYILGFSLAAFIVLSCAIGINKLLTLIAAKRSGKKQSQ